MCYQKYHDCKYCKQPYPCEVDDYICPTINHDADMYMCESCKTKLEHKLSGRDLDDVDLFDVNIEDFLR